MTSSLLRSLLAAAILGAWAPSAVLAQDHASVIEEQQRTASEAAERAAKVGPVAIPLADQVVLDLPSGFAFIPQPEAGVLLHASGNTPPRDLLGAVVPNGDGGWIAILRFVEAGYINDDDAKNWDVDGLLETLRQGTEENNKDRLARGFEALEIRGWIERPAYDSATHRLVWSALVAKKAGTAEDAGVNYNTFVLGRDGYVSLNFVTTPHQIPTEKAIAHRLLSSIVFVSGKSYADFNASTDRVAGFGLAALIAGAAAKKLGFFAIVAGFLAKFAKIILVGFVALGVSLKKLFRRPSSGRADP